MEHVDSNKKFNNVKQSEALDNVLLWTIQGDALTILQNMGNRYTKKGFEKVAHP